MATLRNMIIGLAIWVPALAGFSSNSKDSLKASVVNAQWDDVAAQTKQLLASESSPQQKDLLRMVQAIAFHRQGRFDESIKVLEPIQEQSVYFAWTKIFMARLAYVNFDNALLKTSLQKLQQISLKGDLKIEASFYEAYLLNEEHKWKPAEKILQKIERFSRGTDLHVPILESLALSQAKRGGLIEVCKTLKKIYIRYPLHGWLKTNAPEIRAIPIGDNHYSCAVKQSEFESRLRSLNLIGNTDTAKKELEQWWALTKATEKQRNLMQAQQLLSEGQPEDAVKLLSRSKEGEQDLEVLEPLSFAAARAGDLKLGIEASLAVHRSLGFSKHGTMALYQAAAWAYQVRDYDASEKYFRQVNPIRLTKAYRKEAQWYLGWLRYLKGDFSTAERSFRLLQKNFGRKKGRDSSERIQYWLAMSLLKQEKLDKARVLFRALSERKGMNYYAYLAKERLKQMPDRALTPGVPHDLAQVTLVSRAAYFTPYGEEAPWPNDQESEETQEEISVADSDESALIAEQEAAASDAEDENSSQLVNDSSTELFSQGEANLKLERAKSFWLVGLEDLARNEVSDLERYSRGLDVFRRVIDEYRQMGLYNKLSTMGQSFVGRANMTNNRFIYESIYPQAYGTYVERFSKEHNVPQALIWGIMKAESTYRPWVKSPVGALGLMQVMPNTGQKLAKLMDVKSFAPESLLQPEDAVRYGSKYLERMAKKFDSSVQLIAAAYNAGPHRVSQWLYYFGYMQMDEWVEHIPFLETRNYVKKVTMNYLAYTELYGRNMGTPVSLIEPVPVQIIGAPETKETWNE